MLSLESAVPIYFGIIESKNAVLFMDFYIKVGLAGEELVGEGAVGVLVAYFVDFVDDSTDNRVFVEEDGGY